MDDLNKKLLVGSFSNLVFISQSADKLTARRHITLSQDGKTLVEKLKTASDRLYIHHPTNSDNNIEDIPKEN